MRTRRWRTGDLTWYEYWQKFEHGGAQSFLSFGADGFVTHEMAHFLHSPDDVLLDPYWGWKFTEDSPFDQDRLALPEFLDEVEVISIQTILEEWFFTEEDAGIAHPQSVATYLGRETFDRLGLGRTDVVRLATPHFQKHTVASLWSELNRKTRLVESMLS